MSLSKANPEDQAAHGTSFEHFCSFQLAKPLLLRRTGLLLFNLQFVHHLLHVENRSGDIFGPCALCLRADLTSQRDDVILDGVFHGLVFQRSYPANAQTDGYRAPGCPLAGNDIWSRDHVWSGQEAFLRRAHENETPPFWKSVRFPCRWPQGRIATSTWHDAATPSSAIQTGAISLMLPVRGTCRMRRIR